VYAGVPKALQGSLPANTWASTVLAVVGGKGGGSPGSAQGQVGEGGSEEWGGWGHRGVVVEAMAMECRLLLSL
jgi:hypothetical protein